MFKLSNTIFLFDIYLLALLNKYTLVELTSLNQMVYCMARQNILILRYWGSTLNF